MHRIHLQIPLHGSHHFTSPHRFHNASCYHYTLEPHQLTANKQLIFPAGCFRISYAVAGALQSLLAVEHKGRENEQTQYLNSYTLTSKYEELSNLGLCSSAPSVGSRSLNSLTPLSVHHPELRFTSKGAIWCNCASLKDVKQQELRVGQNRQGQWTDPLS